MFWVGCKTVGTFDIFREIARRTEPYERVLKSKVPQNCLSVQWTENLACLCVHKQGVLSVFRRQSKRNWYSSRELGHKDLVSVLANGLVGADRAKEVHRSWCDIKLHRGNDKLACWLPYAQSSDRGLQGVGRGRLALTETFLWPWSRQSLDLQQVAVPELARQILRQKWQ